MKKRFLPLLFILILWPSGCGREETPYGVDLTKREHLSHKQEKDVVTYAYLPQYSHVESYKRHYLLIKFLRKETGLNIKQIFPDTFDEHMKMVGQGRIDISYSNPFIYIKLAHRYGAKAFARVVEPGGRKDFRGQIICRTDNVSIRTLMDCRGKNWIAVDPTSAGGYLYPLGHFYMHGIRKEDFRTISFAQGPGGKQEKVVLAVHAGTYDVGTIREGALDVVSDKIDVNEIRILANTRWYPGWVYAVRPDLSSDIVEKTRNAFFKLDCKNPDHKRVLDGANMQAIIPSEDKDFEPLRELAALLGIGLNDSR